MKSTNRPRRGRAAARRPAAPPPEPGWTLLSSFYAVMHSGSLSAAARRLALAQPTVRRHVAALEAQLGRALFVRSRAGLVPTAAARAMLPHADAIAAAARAAVRAASGEADAAAGTVRIAGGEVVGAEVLPPMLASLVTAHPRLQLELSLSNRNEDLLRRDADLAVRMVRPTQAGLLARRIGTIEIGLFASVHYLARRPAPVQLEQLREHALVGPDRDRALLQGLAAMGVALRPADFAVRTDADAAQLACVRAGLGIGVMQRPLAARDPTLVRVLPQLTFPLPVWLAMHEDLRSSTRVRLVFDHLAVTLAAYATGPEPGTRPRRSA
ncbi:MAG: LysR family transcriptional regulator [Nannocystaceae bacterium]|nr:LysR family transcriptional regulator [Nannocystaceae bacterium]